MQSQVFPQSQVESQVYLPPTQEPKKAEHVQDDSFEWQDLEMEKSALQPESPPHKRFSKLSEVIRIEEEGAIRCGVFSNQGKFLCLGSNSKQLRLFDLSSILTQTGTPSALLALPNYHQGSIYCLDFDRSDQLIASGSNDKTVKVLDIASHSQTVLQGHRGIVRSVQWAQDSQLFSASSDG